MGGEESANVIETLEDLQGIPIELISNGKILYHAEVDWDTINTGDVNIVLQRLIANLGETGRNLWIDWETTDHTFSIEDGATRNSLRVQKYLDSYPGVYRFRASGSAAALRAKLNITIDTLASIIRTREAVT